MTKNKVQKNIPDGWQMKRLGEVCQNINSGKTKLMMDGNYPIFGSTGQIGFHDNFTHQGKTILVARVGANAGRLNLVKGKFSVTDNTLILDVIDSVNIDFLYSIMNKYDLRRLVFGSGQPLVTAGQLKKIKIPLPPLPEQKRIVGVLEVWDFAVEKLERKIVVKENIKKGLMQQLLTGKKRLPGFDSVWEEKTLEKMANVKMGQSPKSKYYNELDNGVPLIQGNADIKKQKTISRIFTSACTKIANFDDVILTVRAPVGEIGIVNQKEVCIGRGVCSITANNKNSQDMIFYLLSHFKQRLRRFEQGSTFTAINSIDVKRFKIKIPELEEQKAIAEILTTADEEIEVLRKKLEILKDQKKFLLNNLVTVEIIVND